eukprot:CAMPEP_0119304276 /NCGR_PEP_ID=MMETSP1333-20130426/5539_1 /TAXON_ID=418940 /ORGANISM="Scyphosphaera apsteinii, Strain RCC1455" /LENGTH=95 /DNA_ID=CAMNT_0007307127 /DNA_START=126 /DNA_END=410 /DNA_ORIENTATION=+
MDAIRVHGAAAEQCGCIRERRAREDERFCRYKEVERAAQLLVKAEVKLDATGRCGDAQFSEISRVALRAYDDRHARVELREAWQQLGVRGIWCVA